jgi:membrane protease YdiL (CAAX protease family)
MMVAEMSQPGNRSRVVGRVLLFWACYMAIALLAGFVSGMVPQQWARLSWGRLPWGLLAVAALVPLTIAFSRRERGPNGATGLAMSPGSVPRFILGALIGAAVYGTNFVVVSALVGGLRLERAPAVDPGTVILTLGMFIALSSMEELGFRGWSLRALVPCIGLWPAQILVAVAFSLTHVAFGWPWQTIVAGVLPSALLFGLTATASGGLAMPIGLHAALNFARWSMGESGTPGLWSMEIEASARASIARVAPISGIAITLSAALGMWLWYRYRWRNYPEYLSGSGAPLRSASTTSSGST